MKLYRIRALVDFNDVKKGDLGGYVQGEENLSHEGNAWIYDNAKVYGGAKVQDNGLVLDNAEVYNNAIIFDNAKVYGNALVYDNAVIFDDAKVYGNARVYAEEENIKKLHLAVVVGYEIKEEE